MAIVKAKVDSDYTVITNSTARNNKISLEAKGLLLFMASRPDDWVFHKNEIMKECSVGRDKLSRIFKELESQGYISITQTFNEKGEFKNNEYLLFVDNNKNPSFINQPLTEKPLTVNPSTVNPHLQKKESLQKKDNTNCELSELKNDGFEYWWKAYPKKAAKPDSQKAFKAATKKMNKEDFMRFVDMISSDSMRRYRETEKQFIPGPAKYIRQELYNDEL